MPTDGRRDLVYKGLKGGGCILKFFCRGGAFHLRIINFIETKSKTFVTLFFIFFIYCQPSYIVHNIYIIYTWRSSGLG